MLLYSVAAYNKDSTLSLLKEYNHMYRPADVIFQPILDITSSMIIWNLK